MSFLDDLLARVQSVLASPTQGGGVPATGTTPSTQLTFDGSDMAWTPQVATVTDTVAGKAPAALAGTRDGDNAVPLIWKDGEPRWQRPWYVHSLGVAAPVLTGWSYGADGHIAQDATTSVGEVLLPIATSNQPTINGIDVNFQRSSAGTDAATRATVKLQQRAVGTTTWSDTPDQVLDVLAGVEDVYGATVSFGVLEATVFRPLSNYAYRLRITGEAGADAKTLKILDISSTIR